MRGIMIIDIAVNRAADTSIKDETFEYQFI